MERISGDARQEIAVYRQKVKEIAEARGSELFSGHSIQWLQLGIGNYFKSFFDKNYRIAVREEFFERLKQHKVVYYNNNAVPDVRGEWDRARDIIAKDLKEIMEIPDRDVSRGRKMELILLLIGDKPDFIKNIRMGENEGTYLAMAKAYFESEKEKAMNTIDKISQLGGELAMNRENRKVLDGLREKWGQGEVKSEGDLRKFKNQYVGAVINAVEKMCVGNPVFLDNLRQNVERLREEAGMEELITGVSALPDKTKPVWQEAKVRNARYEAVKAVDAVLQRQVVRFFSTYGLSAEDMKKALDDVREGFITQQIDTSKTGEDFKKDYMEAVIDKVIGMSERQKNKEGIAWKLSAAMDDPDPNDSKLKNEPKLGLKAETKAILKRKLMDVEALPYLAERVETGDLTQAEKRMFLAREEVKQITDFGQFKKRLYECYPRLDPYNVEDYKLLKAFEAVSDEEIDDLISKTTMLAPAENLRETIRNNKKFERRFNTHWKGSDEALKKALLLYIFEVRRDMVLAKMGVEEGNAFLERYPQFKFILDQAMFDDFSREINDLARK